MNILYHHRTQGRGGEGVHIREIIQALREAGNEVYVVSPPGVDVFAEASGKTSDCWLAKVWRYIGRHTPQVAFELLEIFYNFIAYSNIKKILKTAKIDFIYERYAFFSWAGTSLAQKFNIPLLLEVNEISGIKRQRNQVLVPLAKKIERDIFNKASAIFAVSSFLREEIIQRGINPNKIFLMPNAINEAQFDPQKTGSSIRKKFNLNGKTVIAFIGHFSKWDRLDYLLENFSEIVKKDGNIHLMLVGGGKGARELKSIIRANRLEETVTMPGKISREAVPEYIAAADICIIPASNPFGSPIVLFEYMAMAKPIIAPKLPPLKDVITDGVNGSLFEPQDKSSLQARLLDLINNVEKRARMGEEARRLVLEEYTWKINAGKITAIYNALVKC